MCHLATVAGLTISWGVAFYCLRHPLPAAGGWAVWVGPLVLAWIGAMLAWDRQSAVMRRGGCPADQMALRTARALLPLQLACLAPAGYLAGAPALPLFVVCAAGAAWLGPWLAARAATGTGRGPCRSAGLFGAVFAAGLLLGFQPCILHDAFQYYAQLVSVALDRDLDLFNQVCIHNTYRYYNPFPWPSARYLGTPLLEAPFFLAAHGLVLGLRALGWPVTANGYSTPYLVMVSLASCFFGLAGVLASYRLAREFFGRRDSRLATLAIWLASPLPFFMFTWNGWAHPFAFGLTALFLLLWQRTRARRTLGQWAVLGLVLGLLGLTQPTAGLVAVFPVLEWLGHWRGGRRRDLAQGAAGLLLCAAVAMLVFSPQFAIWKIRSGHWLAAPYGDVGDYHDWLHPQWLGLFFDTARHGLFAWSPLLLPATAGLLWMVRRDRVLALGAIMVTGLSFYIYASWSIWWSGIGFSNRFFIHLTPLFILGGAALLQAVLRRVPLGVVSGLLAVAVLWNVQLMAGYRGLFIPQGIPEPQAQCAAPLTLRALCEFQAREYPAALQSLVGDRWANHVFFASRMFHAWQAGNWRDVGVILCLFLLVAGLGYKVAGSYGDWLRATRVRMRLPVVLVLALALAMAVQAALWYAGRRSPATPEQFHRLESYHAEVAPDKPAVLASAYPLPVERLELLSSLVFGHAIPQGVEVAEVVVEDIHGRCVAFRLRAGIDTAEQSWLRPENRGLLQHTMVAAQPARFFITRAYSSSFYEQLIFHSAWDLPEPMVVREVRVQYLYPFGRLYVADIFLRGDP